MKELLWTPEAIHDREVIYDYIEADNPVAALALDEFLKAAP
jgi:plasmid stabilization system protein ParE